MFGNDLYKFVVSFSSRWALFFLDTSMQAQYFCIAPMPPVPSSTSFILPFDIWFLPGASYLSLQVFCHPFLTCFSSRWTIPEYGEGDPWKSSSSPGCVFSPELITMGFSPQQASFLFWSPKTLSYFFFFFWLLPLGIQNSPISHSLEPRLPLVLTSPINSSLFIKSWRVSLLTVFLITCVRKVPSMDPKNLLDLLCPTMLLCHQVSRGFNFLHEDQDLLT